MCKLRGWGDAVKEYSCSWMYSDFGDIFLLFVKEHWEQSIQSRRPWLKMDIHRNYNNKYNDVFKVLNLKPVKGSIKKTCLIDLYARQPLGHGMERNIRGCSSDVFAVQWRDSVLSVTSHGLSLLSRRYLPTSITDMQDVWASFDILVWSCFIV